MTTLKTAELQRQRLFLDTLESDKTERYYTPRAIVRILPDRSVRECSGQEPISELRQQIGRLNRLRHDFVREGLNDAIEIFRINFFSESRALRLTGGESPNVLSVLGERDCVVECDAVPGLHGDIRETPWSASWSVATGAVRALYDLSRVAHLSISPNSMPRCQFILPGQSRHDAFTDLLRLLDVELSRLCHLFMVALAASSSTCVILFVLLLVAVYLRYGYRHEPSDDDEKLFVCVPEPTRRRA
ncbi:hypothetical protein ACFHW2_39925 [Actinomadura sp. LOL_016]|uniref:hypothetical protein n=1 Tax=unclassified Actinomadura TaxID=2626254 RepID=UPI003A7FDAEA